MRLVATTSIAALLALSCASAPPQVARSEQPSIGATGSAASAVTVVTRATSVPADHRYVGLSDGQTGRILLVDLAKGGKTEIVTARGSPGRPYYAPMFSESADGRRLLVAAVGPAQRSALYLVDVTAGSATLLYEDEEIWSIGSLHGVMSPDGARYAFHGHDGVRVGDTTGGPTRLFVEDDDPSDMAKIWYPLAWSPDRSAIALGQGTDSVTRLGAFRATNGTMLWSGTGSQVSWRGSSPRLAVSGSAGTFGGQ